jgi:hypothetical protein
VQLTGAVVFQLKLNASPTRRSMAGLGTPRAEADKRVFGIFCHRQPFLQSVREALVMRQ